MKKQLIYVGMLLSIAGLSACSEDFTDWADPQSNAQLDPSAQVTAVYQAGKDANIVVEGHDLAVDSVEVVTLASTTAVSGSTVSFKALMLNDTYSVPFRNDNGILRVSLAKLDSLTQEAYQSRASVARDLKLSVQAAATTPDGEGILLAGNDVTVKLTPGTTPAIDPDGYYVVGDFKGWDAAGAIAMKSNGDNVFTLETEATKDNTNFKIFPAAAIAGGILNEDLALGSAVNGDISGDNFLVWNKVQAIKVEKAGKIKISLDLTNFRFTVKDNSAPSEIFMTGSAYAWGGTWKQFVPVNGTKGAFWGIFHFGENEEVKFAPQADWGNDFGFAATISQESITRAGLSDSGGNIKVGKAGWYLVYISVIGEDRKVEFEAPTVYLTGDCSGGWDVFDDARKFTVPADGTGEFASPAFVKDGNVRMCVRPAAVAEWWRAEFNVIDGKIAYRGQGGDQQAVPGKTGQKVYLNFGSGAGRIQ